MKKLVFVFLAAALIFGCQKKDVTPVDFQQDVVFDITNLTPGGSGLKSTADWTCPTDDENNLLEPASAKIVVKYPDGTFHTFNPAVFRLDGKLYTQAIKFPVKENGNTTKYTVKKFLLYAEDGTTLIMATPKNEAKFSEYVTKPVPFKFEVNKFEKAQIPVEVLCFWPQDYMNFGFT